MVVEHCVVAHSLRLEKIRKFDPYDFYSRIDISPSFGQKRRNLVGLRQIFRFPILGWSPASRMIRQIPEKAKIGFYLNISHDFLC